MKFDKHGNGNGLDDLYILPDNLEELDKIADYLKSIKRLFIYERSNVEGHEWAGKIFIAIPFGESLREQIETLTTEED